MNSIEERLLACEKENARLQKRISRQNGLWMIGFLLIVGGGAIAGTSVKNAIFDSIKAKEVVVVDDKGIIRARLAGDMPHAVVAGGRAAKRGGKAAGLMIYDEEGIERGGYVTQNPDSNVMLTLDSKHRQSTIFVAGPSDEQTSALQLWNKAGAIELRSDPNGARLSVSDKSGITYQQPNIASLLPSTCADYKELENKYPGKRICQAKFTDTACQACFKAE